MAWKYDQKALIVSINKMPYFSCPAKVANVDPKGISRRKPTIETSFFSKEGMSLLALPCHHNLRIGIAAAGNRLPVFTY